MGFKKNAREELATIVTADKIKCASLQYNEGFNEGTLYVLKERHTREELEKFLESLDFSYDSGYGSQWLYGLVWLKDGTWLERGEYDGMEWWEHKKLPEIPEECKQQ